MTRLVPCAKLLLVVVCLSVAITTTAVASEKKGELVNESGNALVKSKFVGTAGLTEFETTAGLAVDCKAGTVSGTMANKKEAKPVEFRYTGCESLGKKCKTTGDSAGEISYVSNDIEVDTSTGSKLQDYLLFMIENGSKEVLTFTCGTVKDEVLGSYLVKLGESQEGVLKTKYTLKAEQEKGKQIEPVEVLEKGGGIDKPKLRAEFGGGVEEAGQASTLTITFEESAKFI